MPLIGARSSWLSAYTKRSLLATSTRTRSNNRPLHGTQHLVTATCAAAEQEGSLMHVSALDGGSRNTADHAVLAV
jgi:hypothetical protein